MTLFSEKVLISNISGSMPNLIKKSWTDSSVQDIRTKDFSIWKDFVCTSDLGNVSICFCFSMGHYVPVQQQKKGMEIAITFSANEGLGDPSD